MSNSVWKAPQKVLVTGGTGFIGTYVCRMLAQNGQNAIAAGIEPFSPEGRFVLGVHADAIKLLSADVTHPSAMIRLCAECNADAIVHTPGFGGHENSVA